MDIPSAPPPRLAMKLAKHKFSKLINSHEIAIYAILLMKEGGGMNKFGMQGSRIRRSKRLAIKRCGSITKNARIKGVGRGGRGSRKSRN